MTTLSPVLSTIPAAVYMSMEDLVLHGDAVHLSLPPAAMTIILAAHRTILSAILKKAPA